METKINAQSIITAVMAAHAIAPKKDDLKYEMIPYYELDRKTGKEKLKYNKVLVNPEYVTFKTSERGTQKVLNCKENLQRFADLVRKNAAAFGGGLIKEEKQKPAVSYPSKSISLYKQLIEDQDWFAALQLAEEKLSPMFALCAKGTAVMFVAPIPCDSMPDFVSAMHETGIWAVLEPASMREVTRKNKRSRQAQIEYVQAVYNAATPEQKEKVLSDAQGMAVDQSAIRAQWILEHFIVDDAAIDARIEAQAAQDVAEIVAQAVAVSAIAEAMAPAAETESTPELVTCEAGESESNCASIAQFIHVAADSIGTLRKIDVSRVIEETPINFRPELAKYIQSNRPDLAQEVSDVLEESGTVTSPVAISKEYRYAMVNRPFSIGTAPKDGFIRMDAMPEDNEPHYKMARHGIAVYGRKLTDQETLDYELAPIADDAILENLCAAVTHEMAEYANEYAAMASDDWVDFEWHVINAKERVTTSFCVSIESNRAFADMVLAALKTATLEPCPPVAISSETPAARPVESTNFAADIPLSLAVNAFHGVSMSPERRGASAQAGYAQDMAQDYETMRIQAVKGGTLDLLPEVFARYRVRQAVAYRAYLSSSSRCVSSFIAGPSNFPAARMNKRNDIAHKRLNEYLDGGKMAMQAAIRTLRPDLRAIMSGDADAIDRLTIELAKAERSHEQMKAANKAIRANAEAGEAHQVAALMELGFNEPTAVKLLHPMRPYCKGFEGFTLTNSSANIRRLKGRLEQITAAKARPVETVECSNGITFEDDAPANRVRLYFPGKPDDATRSELKSRGFRWSPTLGAWQAYRNYQTITTAKRMAGEPTASAKDEAPEVAEVAPIEDTSPVVESAEITAPAPEPVPVVEIEATTPAAEIQIEPVAHVVGTESPQAAKEPTPTPDDTQKFRVRAKSGEWRASFMMIGTMYALLFNGDGSKVTTTTYATHAERMQALEAMARATTPPDTPPDGGIEPVDAPTEAPSTPVAECTPGAPVAVSTASDAPLHPRNIVPTNGVHIVDDAFEAWTYQSGARFGFVMYLGKSAKPWKYYGYKSEAARDDGFQRHAAEARDIAAFKAKRKAEDKAKAEQGHGMQVGDVVRSSWGYDQTNVNHYQITKLIGKRTVEVRELAGVIVDREHHRMSGDVAPVWGEFIGEPMKRTVDRNGRVNILREKFGRASKIEPVAIVHGVRCYASTGYSSYA